MPGMRKGRSFGDDPAGWEKKINAPYFPFCSKRCRLVDLGAWLDGDYRVPVESQPQTDDSSEQ